MPAVSLDARAIAHLQDGACGLTGREARRRLEQYGTNAMPAVDSAPWRRAVSKLWAPIPWMLEAAVLLQFMLHEYVEAAVITILLIFNAVLGFVQEGRAQATLDALKSRLALLALVCRDGAWTTLAASELVPGDLVKLTLGSIVAADVQLLEGNVLLDQSMLTGESLPVEGGPGTYTYAGALVRRGEALARVSATGTRTKFGRTAQLVQVAHAASSQQQAVFHLVRNLGLFSGSMILLQLLYATTVGMSTLEVIPLILTALLAAIPVALPATFTLASAIGARVLAGRGVLPTRLSAIDEAATMDVLCSDKTGTLTQNELRVTAVYAAPGFDEARVLGLAALASAETGMDPVDAAICAAATQAPASGLPRRVQFVPFDPAQKMSEAQVRDASGQPLRIVKGAYPRIAALSTPPPQVAAAAAALSEKGYRVLAVGAGPLGGSPSWVGLIALSDPPRPDAKQLIVELRSLGVETIMVTGDAAATAAVVARTVGIQAPVCPTGSAPERTNPGDFGVFAGVLPEDKFHIVRAFQAAGHTVGMCGDGANDAPALRQAQMGIAVSTATDVAKSAAGMVLTQPGLGGIVEAVRAGRVAYQRILTYTLRSVTAKINQMTFLTAGLLVTGHAILTPMLMVIVMIGGDFLAMSATTDHVRASPKPNAWRIGRVTSAAIVLGLCNTVFCILVMEAGMHLGLVAGGGLRTLSAVSLVFATQASFYVVRDRRHLWSSRPGSWVVLSSVMDVALIAALATSGVLVHILPWLVIGTVLLSAALYALLLDGLKSFLFARLGIA